MPRAVMAPWYGGAAGSSAPDSTRVGACTAPSSGARSSAAIASAQPAYPSGAVPRSMDSTADTSAGDRWMYDGVNQRGAVTSASASRPPGRRTRAARSRQDSAVGSGSSAAQQTASDVTRSAALAASQSPTMPPSETPAYPNDVT